MNELKKARAEYEAVPIPEELANIVQTSIQQGKKNYWQKRLYEGFCAARG